MIVNYFLEGTEEDGEKSVSVWTGQL